jgi:hypothetical protein
MTIKEIMIMPPLQGQNTAARQWAGRTSKTKEKKSFCYPHIFKSLTSVCVLLSMTTQ